MPSIIRVWALAVALTVSLAATEARANPDVWVETTIAVAFDEQRVSGLEFSWTFDDFYSAHAIGTYDLDRDGMLNFLEVKGLRTETFDPLSTADYYVHIWSGERKHDGLDVDRFTARIEGSQLVYDFSMGLEPPLDPQEEPVTVSLFDRENFVDFNFADSDFLLVRGAVTPGCKFSVARGEGAQSDHPQPVTLACGG